MYKLRSTSEIYLVGYEEFQVLGCKLPSIRQTLQVFFYNHRSVKLNIRQSATLTIQEISIFWDKAKIPIRKMERKFILNGHLFLKIKVDIQIHKNHVRKILKTSWITYSISLTQML